MNVLQLNQTARNPATAPQMPIFWSRKSKPAMSMWTSPGWSPPIFTTGPTGNMVAISTNAPPAAPAAPPTK